MDNLYETNENTTRQMKCDERSRFQELHKENFILKRIDQSKRRKEILQAQKLKRQNVTDQARELFNTKIKSQVTKYCVPEFASLLMYSEWLYDEPEDFEDNWFAVLCPTGKRRILVAERGKTQAFDKRGALQVTFQSQLPHGNYSSKLVKRTILDAIYCARTKSYYILDVLMWAGQSFFNCEMTFRFFWLHSKFLDANNLGVVCEANRWPIYVLPYFACTKDNLREALMRYPSYGRLRYSNEEFKKFKKRNSIERPPNQENSIFPPATCVGPQLDGILFYHKECGYDSGFTPLVGWLKPFMIPEVLKIDVSDEYYRDKPKNYTNLMKYVELESKRADNSWKNALVSTEHMRQLHEPVDSLYEYYKKNKIRELGMDTLDKEESLESDYDAGEEIDVSEIEDVNYCGADLVNMEQGDHGLTWVKDYTHAFKLNFGGEKNVAEDNDMGE